MSSQLSVAGSPGQAGVSGRRSRFGLLVLAVAGLAFVARLLPMLRGGGLGGIGGYDDGVYYTAAAALVHHRLPYRDFLFLHPPGVLLAAAPFAWLGSHTSDATGFAVGRVAFMLIGAGNAALVAAVLRRYGLAAAAVGGVFYAVFLPPVYAERSTLLEPLGTLAMLLALLLLESVNRSQPRAYLAGAALGAGVSVKIWYVATMLVLTAVQRGSARWRVLAGAVLGATVICGPFFLAAPSAMFRYVVRDQLGRPGTSITPAGRVKSILGLDAVSAAQLGRPALALVMVGLLVLYGVCALVAFTDARSRGYVWLLLTHGVVLMAAPSYFRHYSAFTAAPLALVLGVGAGRLTSAVRRVRWAPPLLGCAALAALLALALPGLSRPESIPFPAAALRPAAAQIPGCVTADNPTALVELNVLTRDLERGCTLWPDVTGWTYDPVVRSAAGHPPTRARNHRWQHLVLGYLQSGDAVITLRPGTGLSPASKALLATRPVLARAGGYTLRGR